MAGLFKAGFLEVFIKGNLKNLLTSHSVTLFELYSIDNDFHLNFIAEAVNIAAISNFC